MHKYIFNQHSYEARISTEADLMIALEGLRKELQDAFVELYDIELLIYGNTEDWEENLLSLSDNSDSVHTNRHNFAGLQERVHEMQATCAWTQSELDEQRSALILYCQQFAYAPEMTRHCKPILECRERELHPRYSFGH